MSGKHNGDGVRNAPTMRHEQSAFGSAAAALTLASLGEMADSAEDTQNDAAIARALSTGYECFLDDQSLPSDEETDDDLDSRAIPSKKIDSTDSKHSAPVGLKPTAIAASAKANADAPAAAGTEAQTKPKNHQTHCLSCFKCCSHVRSTVCLVFCYCCTGAVVASLFFSVFFLFVE